MPGVFRVSRGGTIALPWPGVTTMLTREILDDHAGLSTGILIGALISAFILILMVGG